MFYDRIVPGIFINRPNRFIANVLIDDEITVCHVKNTGRCAELLVNGAQVYLQKSLSQTRKTSYDLISVMKNGRLINMDSAAPNAVFGEWLIHGGLGFVPDYVRPEFTHGNSRFDFYFEHGGEKCLAEVKGVTLEENNVVRFPDAPTLRGVKHLYGLSDAVHEEFDTYAVFVVQLEGVKYLEPNWATHKEFGDAMRYAEENGVKLLAYECSVSDKTLDISREIEIRI